MKIIRLPKKRSTNKYSNTGFKELVGGVLIFENSYTGVLYK